MKKREKLPESMISYDVALNHSVMQNQALRAALVNRDRLILWLIQRLLATNQPVH